MLAISGVYSAASAAILVVGVAVIEGALAFEVRDAGETAADMTDLQTALDADDKDDVDAARQDAMDWVDGAAIIRAELPAGDDLADGEAIWAQVKAAPHAAWTLANDLYAELRGVDCAAAAASTIGALRDLRGTRDPRGRWLDCRNGAAEARP
jgi:hypothetical protein